MKTVLLPAQNEKDAREVPIEVKDGLKIIYVRYVIQPSLNFSYYHVVFRTLVSLTLAFR